MIGFGSVRLKKGIEYLGMACVTMSIILLQMDQTTNRRRVLSIVQSLRYPLEDTEVKTSGRILRWGSILSIKKNPGVNE